MKIQLLFFSLLSILFDVSANATIIVSQNAQEVMIPGYSSQSSSQKTSVTRQPPENIPITIQQVPDINPNITKAQMSEILDTLDLSAWSKYGKNLFICIPGKFKLINFVALSNFVADNTKPILKTDFIKMIESQKMTYEIVGWVNNNCYVKINKKVLDTQTNKIEVEAIDCYFPPSTLKFLTPNAELISKGNLPTENDTGEAIQQMICAPANTDQQ